MAKNIYVGVSGVAKKAKQIYVGVNGKARKVKKIYVGVNGVAKLCYSSGVSFSYTGQTNLGSNKTYEFEEGQVNIKILSSGTLKMLSGSMAIEAFLCGGGKSGGTGSAWPEGDSNFCSGGQGGDGGSYKNVKITLVEGHSYTITIGASNNDTTITDSSGNTIATTSGGSFTPHTNNSSGKNGVYAFGDSSYDGVLYGPSGGFGALCAQSFEYGSWSDWAVQEGAYPGGSDGGASGASSPGSGNNATGRGAGGGGACGGYSGGQGGPGIICMRSAA